MYNALGYSKLNIAKIIFSENIVIGIFSFVLAIIVSSISFIAFENVILMHNARLYLLNLNVDFNSLIYGLMISLVIPIIASIVIMFTNNFSKNNVME